MRPFSSVVPALCLSVGVTAAAALVPPAHAADPALVTAKTTVTSIINDKLTINAGVSGSETYKKYQDFFNGIAGLDPKDTIASTLEKTKSLPTDAPTLKSLKEFSSDLSMLQTKYDELKAAKAASTTATDAEKKDADDAITSAQKWFDAFHVGTKKEPGDAVTKLDAFFKGYAADTLLPAKRYPGLDSDPLAGERLKKLTDGLPAFADTISNYDTLKSRLTVLATVSALLPAGTDGKNSADMVVAAVATLGKNMDDAAKRIATLANAETDAANKKALDMVKAGNDARRRKAGAAAAAYAARASANDYTKSVGELLRAWDNQKGNISSRYKAEADAADTAFMALNDAQKEVDENAGLISSLLIASGDGMVTQEVRLSFFPSVEKLMRFLNPTTQAYDPANGKLIDEEDKARNALQTAESSIGEKRADVEDIKTRRQRMLTQILRVRQNAADAQTRVERAVGQQLGLTDALTTLQDKLTQSTDAAEKVKLQKQIDDAKKKQTLQDEVVTAAKTDKTNADADLQTLSDQSAGLGAAEQTARDAQTAAQKLLNELRASLPALAENEAQAFADARDHSPYLKADPVFDDPDPARRIFIYGFPDNRTLYLRGDRDSVREVREIIAEFDKPAPQAKLTFYTMQFSGDVSGQSKKTAAKSTQAIEIVSEQLDGVRQYTEQTVSALRDAVADEINTKAMADAKLKTPAVPLAAATVRGRLSRYEFYTPAVSRALGLHLENNSEISLNANTLFYDAAVTRYTLPDPTRLTTLGELIFVLALGRQSSREKVSKDFETKLTSLFKSLDDGAADTTPADTTPAATPPSGATNPIPGNPPGVPTGNGPASTTGSGDKGDKKSIASSHPKTLKEAMTNVLIRLRDDFSLTQPKKGTGQDTTLWGQASNLLLDALSQVFNVPKGQTRTFSGDLITITVNSAKASADNSSNAKKAGDAKPAGDAKAGQTIVTLKNASVIVATGEVVPPTEKGDAAKPDESKKPDFSLYEPLTPIQKEILDALLSKARTDVAGSVYSITRRLDDMPEELRYSSQAAKQLREQYLPLIGWLTWGVGSEYDTQNSREPEDWRTEGLRALSFTKTSQEAASGTGVQLPPLSFDGVVRNTKLPDDAPTLKNLDRLAFEIARVQYDANPLSKATGRIEAADMLIRTLIDNYNDRLDTLVRRPALSVIREQISQLKGVSFGGVEETSFIATNRQVSRVDPRASASLSVEEQNQAGEAASALAALYTKQKERETTRDSILGTAATTAISQASHGNPELTIATGVTSLLAALLGPGAKGSDADNAAPGEIYSITSGNQYKITPIFGPSGQAMRFQFDFAGTTRVREPEGTVNPALPRVERYTVNTEVGLNNLEMRPITSFDSNYQLGQPRRQSGGLPFLNQMPGLKYLPLIGYFTVREGKQAIRQRSVIVAQTVMYPTIADITGLMLDGAMLPVTFSPEPPSSSREPSEKTAFSNKGLSPSDIELSPSKSITVTITLNRPAKKDGTLTLNLPKDGDLVTGEEAIKATHSITRGQIENVFVIRRLPAASGSAVANPSTDYLITATYDDGLGNQETHPYHLKVDNSEEFVTAAALNINTATSTSLGESELWEGVLTPLNVSLSEGSPLKSEVKITLSSDDNFRAPNPAVLTPSETKGGHTVLNVVPIFPDAATEDFRGTASLTAKTSLNQDTKTFSYVIHPALEWTVDGKNGSSATVGDIRPVQVNVGTPFTLTLAYPVFAIAQKSPFTATLRNVSVTLDGTPDGTSPQTVTAAPPNFSINKTDFSQKVALTLPASLLSPVTSSNRANLRFTVHYSDNVLPDRTVTVPLVVTPAL